MPSREPAIREKLLQLRERHRNGKLTTGQYEQVRAPLERQLIDAWLGQSDQTPEQAHEFARPRLNRRLVAILAAIVAVIAGVGYALTGSPQRTSSEPEGFAQGAGQTDGAASAPHAVGREQVAALVERLAEHLRTTPGDAEGWSMLGRSYHALDQPAKAAEAFAKVIALRPKDANALADYADAVAVRNGRKLEGEPAAVIEKALALEPDNLKALLLAGTVAFNKEDYASAVRHWDRAVRVGPPDSILTQQARNAAAEARERGHLPPAETSAQVTGPTGSAAARTSAQIAVNVSLSPAIKAQVSPDDTVFVFARPAQGSRMPLALVRKQVKDLPARIVLDDSTSMSPSTKLSSAQSVIVGARVSKSGQAMPAPGDLEGLSEPVGLGGSPVQLVIAKPVK